MNPVLSNRPVLTERQRQVVELIAAGFSNEEIGELSALRGADGVERGTP